MTHSLNESMNDETVNRTASATPGLLKLAFGMFTFFTFRTFCTPYVLYFLYFLYFLDFLYPLNPPVPYSPVPKSQSPNFEEL